MRSSRAIREPGRNDRVRAGAHHQRVDAAAIRDAVVERGRGGRRVDQVDEVAVIAEAAGERIPARTAIERVAAAAAGDAVVWRRRRTDC